MSNLTSFFNLDKQHTCMVIIAGLYMYSVVVLFLIKTELNYEFAYLRALFDHLIYN